MNIQDLNGKRCVVGGLFSSKDKEHLQRMDQTCQKVEAQGGVLVGRLIQRRGVSRSKGPGGSKALDQPLDGKYIFSKGKLKELKVLLDSESADVLVMHNSLTKNQKQSLNRRLDTAVCSFQDDLEESLPSKC